MDYISKFTKMTRRIASNKSLESQPFTLLDVGCSGGISNFWRIFEPSLTALGIDPVVHECARLNVKETNANIHYLSAFIGLSGDHPFVIKRGDREPFGGNPWNRLSVKLAIDILQSKTKKEDKLTVLNDWENSELTDSVHKIAIDDLVKNEKLTNLDFIKIDVDGFDLDAILSAVKITEESPVLGFALEVNFNGGTSETDHTFHNTDKLMRQWGFDLFGLSIRRYSVSALPAPFENNAPGKSVFGKPYQGDAIYLRDPMALNTPGAPHCPPLTSYKLLKLACLFECFGLPDYAAEVIQANKIILNDICVPDDLLNILAIEVNPTVKDYAEYLQKFKNDPTEFYLSKRSQG